jgi:hypothetical protein
MNLARASATTPEAPVRLDHASGASPFAMDYHDIFTYDPESGKLFWKQKPAHLFSKEDRCKAVNTRCAGKEVGYRSHKSDGKPHAITIEFFKKRMVAHRLAWHLMGRTVPSGMMIDHINGNPFDNRLCNLRLASRRQNATNTTLRPGKHGVSGVAHHPGRPKAWSSRIRTENGLVHLGYFFTKGLASLAYMKARMMYHKEFIR